MYQDGFNKLYWGFLFIMIDFRLQGVDVLPDIVGYILFAVGFGILAAGSEYFDRARNLNIPMIILSIFSIYEKPVQGGGIQFGSFGIWGVLIGIAATVLNLLVIYNLFMGIKNMADQQGKMDLSIEAEKRWSQYLGLQIAAIFTFILILVPAVAFIWVIVLFIAAIILTVAIMRFIKSCGESL